LHRVGYSTVASPRGAPLKHRGREGGGSASQQDSQEDAKGHD
jgi:hypothetical protein